MRIVFWQNIPSFHQSATIRALASMQDCDVTLAFQDELPQIFRDGGWLVPEFGNAQLHYPKNDEDISKLIYDYGNDNIHVFSGIRFPMVRKAFLIAAKTKSQIGILAEAADWRGFNGLVRSLLYRFEYIQFGSRIDFVLAMGELGARWYSQCGFPLDKIYPYIYVVENIAPGAVATSNTTNQLIYVGQCIRRKGLDVLLSALAMHSDLDWHLDIVGDGPERDNLIRQYKKESLADKVTFHGALSNNEARIMISQADCLVLPSRWDGWGAVVNEALMMGVPAICSDLCGASDLLRNPERGAVFKAGSVVDLARVLELWIRKGKKSQETSDHIRAWSKSIEGETLAVYLRDVVDAAAGIKDRPQVPWRNGGQLCA